MKKSLFAILGLAVLLAGCTKELDNRVSDLETRVDQLETQVAANKAAIEALQKASFITDVSQTETGWTITLSDGKVLAIYNGKDGKDGKDGQDGKDGSSTAGDSFFSSVVVDGDTVVFTLTDGRSFTVPFASAAFAISLTTDEAVVKAGGTTAIPYSLTGGTTATTINVVAGGYYKASVDTETQQIIITAPETFSEANVMVVANREDGKTNVKTIRISEKSITVDSDPFARAAYFWGDSFTASIVSNVAVSVTSDVSWLELNLTKAAYQLAVTIGPTPSCITREGHIYVKDNYGNVVQTITVAQSGTFAFFLNNMVSYDDWDSAYTALSTATADGNNIATDGSVTVYVSQDADLGLITLPANDAIKSLNVVRRPYGGVDPAKTYVQGVVVPAGLPTTVSDVTIRPKETSVVSGANSGYPIGILVQNGAVNTLTATNVIFDGTDETYVAHTPTMIYDQGSNEGSSATFTNCTFKNAGQRVGQIFGNGTYTFDGCNFDTANAGYAIRMYNATNLVLRNNSFDTPIIANLRTGGNEFTGTVTLGDGTTDNNIYSENVTDIFTGKQEVKPGEQTGGIVKLGAFKYASVSAALAHAQNGDVIEVEEGEIDDNIKIPSGTSVTVTAASGAARDNVIINGNIEVSGSLTLSGVTVRTKQGVTNNSVTVSQTGDGYVWGHTYLVRVELGASDVTFDNVHFDATADVSDFASTLSMIWISDAKNVIVRNCIFDTNEKGSYAPNQTHTSNVVFENNQFNAAGRKAWAIRAMDVDDITVKGNYFAPSTAIEVYNADNDNFRGRLVLGDGESDDNIYAASVTKAIACSKTRYELAQSGAVILPETAVFNSPATSTVVREYKLDEVWSYIDNADWSATVPDLGSVRNMAMNGNGVYLGATGGKIYTLDLESGAVKDTYSLSVEKKGLFNLDGMTSLSDGTILLSNLATSADHKFEVYSFDGSNVETLLSYPMASGSRLGDMITASGSGSAPVVYDLDFSTSSATIYKFELKKGETASTNAGKVVFEGTDFRAIGSVAPKGDEFYLQADGKTNLIANLDFSAGTGTITEVAPADAGTVENRGIKFFTVGGVEYAALLEMTGFNGTNSFGGVIRVYALPNGKLSDLNGATAVVSKAIPSTTANGNACGNLDVLQVGTKVYIGVAIRSTGAALYEFKF